jgi:hypothetical protein
MRPRGYQRPVVVAGMLSSRWGEPERGCTRLEVSTNTVPDRDLVCRRHPGLKPPGYIK